MAESSNFWSSTFIGSLFQGRSGNDRYISQPTFNSPPLRFDKQEHWVSIAGNERQIYLTTPELRIIIDRMAFMFSNGLFFHKNKKDDVIENSPIVNFLERPNILQSRNEWMAQWFIQRCLYGNVFVYTLRGTRLMPLPTALWNLPPCRMAVNRTGHIWKAQSKKDIISGYKLMLDDNKFETFSSDEIIQFNFPDPDDPIVSSSPLQALKMPISNLRAAYGTSNVILSKRGAFGALSSDAKDSSGAMPLTAKEMKNASDQYTRDFGIGDTQSKIMVVSKALKWTSFGFPKKDLMLFEEIDQSKRAIIDIFGANENMFSRNSGGKGSTFNNVEMGERQCYQNTLQPIADDLASSLADDFGMKNSGDYLELSFEHLPVMRIDESDTKKKNAETISILLMAGVSAERVSEIVGVEIGTVRVVQASI